MYQVGIFAVEMCQNRASDNAVYTSVNLKGFCVKFRFESFQILITVLCKGRVITFLTQFANTKHSFHWFGGFAKGEK